MKIVSQLMELISDPPEEVNVCSFPLQQSTIHQSSHNCLKWDWLIIILFFFSVCDKLNYFCHSVEIKDENFFRRNHSYT